ncbi:MAG: VCBS repeat-containing protein [Bacteroidota bacterium]
MITSTNFSRSRHYVLMALSGLLIAIGCLSCTKDDDPIVEPPINSGIVKESFLFRYDKNDGSVYRINPAGTDFGSMISEGSGLGGWDHLAGVDAGVQFLVMHDGNNKFAVRHLYSLGQMGGETDSGSWAGNYETFFGFHVGSDGYIFGQDSYGDHNWFVQRVTGQGKLGAETDNGTWNNYYPAATPLYVNGETYLFFQTSSNDHYWFISHVSSDGTIHDVNDGYWDGLWEKVTSFEIDGETYLIGETEDGTSGEGLWFIQRINSNGTMGEETDRGTWRNYYQVLTAFVNNGQAYIFGAADNHQFNGRNYFFQEITADGKMGTETSHGTLDRDFDFAFPFTLYDSPGSFRYTIGWDLSKSTAAPARSWSTRFTDAWYGEVQFGGGAALYDIDKDVAQRYDAVLMGIQTLDGPDRYYYKVAWNLDGAGKASAWSQTILGPAIGESQAGGGADIGDIDGDGEPDLLLMNVDDPAGCNSFRYHIGWNLGTNGKASSWSSMIQGPDLGEYDSGGGAALGDIDRNGRPDFVFMGIDNPDQNNQYWYIIGKNPDITGKVSSWSPRISAPVELYFYSAGGGAALVDVNGNDKLDLILMNIDSREGDNEFWVHVGWDIDINGNAVNWSSFIGPKPGWITKGGGAAVADIDKNGILDLLLMAIDDPFGHD